MRVLTSEPDLRLRPNKALQQTALCAREIGAFLKLESARLPSRSIGAPPLNARPFGGIHHAHHQMPACSRGTISRRSV